MNFYSKPCLTLKMRFLHFTVVVQDQYWYFLGHSCLSWEKTNIAVLFEHTLGWPPFFGWHYQCRLYSYKIKDFFLMVPH